MQRACGARDFQWRAAGAAVTRAGTIGNKKKLMCGLLCGVMQAGDVTGIKVVARQWHSIALMRQLTLKHGLLLLFKGHDADREVIAPHTDEPIIV